APHKNLWVIICVQRKRVMRSFPSDCREAFVISLGYGMGDPLAPSQRRGEQGGGRHHPSVTL
ncbi:MAG: hypothetical protein K8R45_14740, partial [Desulfobacterales bacterium]|nr:hypothetical protein [Desulfobacterales bacterium]